MNNRHYIFVYGSEMRGMPSERVLGSLECSRQLAVADGTLYSPSASFPVSIFGNSSENVVRGELIQVQQDSVAAALDALSQANGYLGAGVPGNLVELQRIDVRLFDGEEKIKGVWAFAAPNDFVADDDDMIKSGDWRARRKAISGQQGINSFAGNPVQASVD